MAEFSDGFKDEVSNASGLQKELKTLNASLKGLVSSLTKMTGSSIFSDKEYFSKALSKGSVTNPSIDSLKETQEIIEKTKQLLKVSSHDLKEYYGISEITKKQMKEFLKSEKERLEIQKELYSYQRKQDDLLGSLFKKANTQAKENIEQQESQKKGSSRQTQEEREIEKARYKDSGSLLPEAMFQSFTQNGGVLGKLIGAIGQVKFGARTPEQFDEFVDTRQEQNKLDKRKELNLYEYDPENAKDKKELLDREGKSKEYDELSKRVNELISLNREATTLNSDLKKVIISDIELKQEKPITPDIELKQEKPLDWSVSGVTPDQVKRVMKNNGIGLVYLGEILNKKLDKLSDKEKETQENSSSLLPSFIPLLIKGLLPFLPEILLGVGLAVLAGAIIKALFDEETMKKWRDGQKKGAEEYNEYMLSEEGQDLGYHMAVPTPEKELDKRSPIYRKYEKLKEIAAKSDPESDEALLYDYILGQTRSGRFKGNPEGFILSLYQTESKLPLKEQKWTPILNQFHDGGIIGSKELLAQKGEVILPISESQYGLQSGILKPTPTGGMSINKESVTNTTQINNSSSIQTSKMESLLEQLLVAINTNLIKAVESTKPATPIPQYSSSPSSYRSN